MIHYVRPAYPLEAKEAHIQGVVRLRVFITKTGDVADVQTISAAIEAVNEGRIARGTVSEPRTSHCSKAFP
jgi:hypothetical protein